MAKVQLIWAKIEKIQIYTFDLLSFNFFLCLPHDTSFLIDEVLQLQIKLYMDPGTFRLMGKLYSICNIYSTDVHNLYSVMFLEEMFTIGLLAELFQVKNMPCW